MNVKEILENYNSYKLQITIYQNEIENLKEELYSLQASKIDGMPKPQGYTKSKIEEMIVKTESKISEKERYINKLNKNIQVVDELIRTLKRYNQDIIKLRYFDKLSIEEIADKKNRDYRTIQRIIGKSIKIMQAEFTKKKE